MTTAQLATLTSGLPEGMQLTTAATWQAQGATGEWFVLPGSGNAAKLRRPGLINMIARAGTIPNPLSAEVIRFLADADLTRTPSPDERIQAFRKNAVAFEELMRATFVYPRVAPKDVEVTQDMVNEGWIDALWINDQDVIWIVYTFLEGNAAKLLPFRLVGSAGENRLLSEAVRQASSGDSGFAASAAEYFNVVAERERAEEAERRRALDAQLAALDATFGAIGIDSTANGANNGESASVEQVATPDSGAGEA